MFLHNLSFKSLTNNLYRVLFILAFLPTGCHNLEDTKADVKQVVIKDKNGLPQEIYTLKDSLLHGERILFFPGSKDTAVLETHENGQFNGAYRSFYGGNKLKLKGQYINDEMVGLWYKYDERGFLIEVETI
ncbi:MAG: toxin-antitoxin system YwqK family antitoxin [Bacteroidota bacterium]